MAAWSVERVCRTLLLFALTILDGCCFVIQEPDIPNSPVRNIRKTHNRHHRYHHLPDHKHKDYASSVTCEYNGKVYPPGEYRISPCVSCVCEDSGELRCTSETCDPEAGCIKFDPVPGQCCPQCLQYGCRHNGTGYPRGASIPAGPCTKCYCPWHGRGGDHTTTGFSSDKPICMEFNCPAVKCVDSTVPRGHCCPFCPNGENCWLDDLVIPSGQDVWVDKCRSCYCPEGAEADGDVKSSTNGVSSRKPKRTSSDGRRRQGYERKALCYRHSGCIEW